LSAHYIESMLFPNEHPLAHLEVEGARELYAAIAYFRGEDVPAPPTAAPAPQPERPAV
jgi:hypothetical protein